MRLTGSHEREHHKWLLAALGALVATVVFAIGASVLVVPPGNWAWAPALVAFPLTPLSIGIAISRYRLYDIDRIVGRTVGWAVITLFLVAVFAGGVIGLQALLAGVTQGQTLAVAASTLVAFTLFQPVRRQVQSAVDRRFDRARYDAQQTVETFAEHLRGEVDLTEIQHEMVKTVQFTVRPMHEVVWLRSMME